MTDKKVNRALLVIKGPAIQYVDGLREGDFAVIHAHTLFISGDTIHGVVYDNHGRCSSFSMPLCKFYELEYQELEDDEDPGPLAMHT